MLKLSKVFLFFTLFSRLILATDTTDTGGWNGGGDRRSITDNTAWYTELSNRKKPRVIRYCIATTNDTKYSPSEIDFAIRSAFKTWAEYIDRHKINSKNLVGLATTVRNTVLEKEETLPEVIGEYNGCSTSADLRFEMGTSYSRIELEKKRYSNPVAFSDHVKRKVYIDKTMLSGDSKEVKLAWNDEGYVWVSNHIFEKEYAREIPRDIRLLELQAIFTHEIGHVYATGYVEGTIMARDFMLALEQTRKLHLKIKTIEEYRRALKKIVRVDSLKRLLLGNIKSGRSFDVDVVGLSPREYLKSKRILGRIFGLDLESLGVKKLKLEVREMSHEKLSLGLQVNNKKPKARVFESAVKIETGKHAKVFRRVIGIQGKTGGIENLFVFARQSSEIFLIGANEGQLVLTFNLDQEVTLSLLPHKSNDKLVLLESNSPLVNYSYE